MLWLNELLNHPPMARTDFVQRVYDYVNALAGAKSVALYFDGAMETAATLLAAWQVGAEVFLLPNQKLDALAWAKQADVFLSDDNPIQSTENIHEIIFRLPEKARLWLQTSGSTGTPKIVAKTCEQMCIEAAAVAKMLPENWQNRAVAASISAQHLYGLTFRVFVALKMGWTLSNASHRYPEDLLAQTVDIWLTSPSVLNHFSEQRDWANVRLCGVISAGGMLPEHTIQLFENKINLSILDIYGSTETGVIARRWGLGKRELLPEVVARIDGGLHIQSAWSNGEQILADNVELNHNELILHGRNDRIIKLGDKRISLNQIEHILMMHDYLADVVVGTWHNRVAVWAMLSAEGVQQLREFGRKALVAKLRQSLVLSVEKVALPRYWRFQATELPRNSQGKLAVADFEQIFAKQPTQPNWQLISQNENEWQFSGSVPINLRYFMGHFDEFPLVAGVVQIQWAMDLARQFDWGNLPIVQMENLKYQQFIRPNDTVIVSLRWDAEKCKAYFSLSVDGKMCASGRAVFQAA
ncbi:AMP-binding protein [Simonsiella muelleri]|uniref:Uncharacterized protein n=1 Tax=Simonsiella muelleri ATCC 29453 TaxID=641147 RepID=V9H916_9NEIS|nr:AMP-binding protein [Simonsiella muelleri]AUX62095.1 hypothetical protein BWP33_09980 [Simonsiella muelleri ATCC 29453]EFG31390.1 hypothetical protein HMPREF9021_00659 [Simonsiella muelleri ATCC 29453]UBQ54188.1 AMP-binding protein [Simonsiella muelleri]